jgi:PAS domain S-box-containing protein
MGYRTRQLLLKLCIPLAAVGAATLLAMQVHELRTKSYLFVFMAAVVICVRLGGLLSGLLGMIFSVASIAFYLMPPDNSFAISDRGDIFRLAMFSAVSLMVLAIYGSRGRSEAELRASEQRLALALDSAHMGVWDYNLLTRKFYWSRTLEAIYGRTDGSFSGTYGRFFGYIHFDDQPLFNRAITRTIDEGTDYEVDHRIVLPDGSVRWVNTRGRVFFNDASRAERIVGIATDITAKKKYERQQQLSRDAADDVKLSTVA